MFWFKSKRLLTVYNTGKKKIIIQYIAVVAFALQVLQPRKLLMTYFFISSEVFLERLYKVYNEWVSVKRHWLVNTDPISGLWLASTDPIAGIWLASTDPIAGLWLTIILTRLQRYDWLVLTRWQGWLWYRQAASSDWPEVKCLVARIHWH